MSRSIKFRAWDTEDKVMRSWKELTLEKDRGDSTWFIGYPASKVVTKFDHKQELMQFTGLKDKNGTEIYEGDILSDENYTNMKDLVVYKDGQYVLWDYPDANLFDCLGEWELEIIGNIHEHPHLLERD